MRQRWETGVMQADEGPDGARDAGSGPEAAGFCGVVLAGGTAARMDGIDKAGLELDGRTLLDRAVDAFADADEVVVVGPRTVPTPRPVTFTREDPPRGGPVAGLPHRRRRPPAPARPWSGCWPSTCRT